SRDTAVPDYLESIDAGVEGMRIGVFRNVYRDDPGADPEQSAAIERTIETLAAAGAAIIELELEGLDQFTAVARILLSADGYAIHEDWLRTVPELYGKGCKGRLLQGALLSARDYIQAQRLRRRLTDHLDALMSGVDVIVTASCTDATPRIDDSQAARKRHLHQV